MPLVYFYGRDGSGKSTLARVLAERLNKKGFKVKISWMRGTHTLACTIAKLLSKFVSFKGYDNPYYGITIPEGLRRLWQILEFISALPVMLFKFILPSALGYWVVADRYIPDLIAWISLTTHDEDYLERIEARFLLRLSSKACFKIHTTSSAWALLQRKAKVDGHFGASEMQLYDWIGSAVGAYRLDTTDKSVDESSEEVFKLLGI